MSQPLLSKAEVTKRIDAQLTELLDAELVVAKQLHPSYGKLIDELRTLVLRGGKRTRPYLVYLAYAGSGGQNSEAILKLATSQELLHSFLLIHDDIIDGDTRRWGGPNVAGVYLAQGSDLQQAENLALLAGDVAASLANDAIILSDFPADSRLQALQRLGRTTRTTIGGEAVDVLGGELGLDPDSILQMYRQKTATYSFDLPLWLGATMAEAPASTIDALHRYAMAVGIAFQLTDDLLGLYGDEAATGKSVFSDMREGKQTWLIAQTGESAELRNVWGKPDAGKVELAVAQKAVEQSGAKQASLDLAGDYAEQAVAALAMAELSTEVAQQLTDLAKSLANRTR